MWWYFITPLTTVQFSTTKSVYWETFVWIDSDAEQTRICLQTFMSTINTTDNGMTVKKNQKKNNQILQSLRELSDNDKHVKKNNSPLSSFGDCTRKPKQSI